MRVRRRAQAKNQKLARAVVLERVPGAWRDEDRVPRTDNARLPVDLQLAGALRDEVELLASLVVVAPGRLAGLQRGFRKALRGRVVQLPDRGAVLRRERLDAVEAPQVHSTEARTSATRSC